MQSARILAPGAPGDPRQRRQALPGHSLAPVQVSLHAVKADAGTANGNDSVVLVALQRGTELIVPAEPSGWGEDGGRGVHGRVVHQLQMQSRAMQLTSWRGWAAEWVKKAADASLACREQPQHVPAVCGGVVNCHCCDMFMMHGRITGYGVPTVLGPSCRQSSAPNAVRACNQQGSTSGETSGVHEHCCVPGAYGVGNNA